MNTIEELLRTANSKGFLLNRLVQLTSGCYVSEFRAKTDPVSMCYYQSGTGMDAFTAMERAFENALKHYSQPMAVIESQAAAKQEEEEEFALFADLEI